VSEKPPFEPIRFACYLIAAIMAVECLVVIIGAATCLIWAKTLVTDPTLECDPKGRLFDLLTSALAAALALLAGFRGSPPPPPPPKG